MKTFNIGWLNKCRCGNKSHMVKTARGNNAGLWDDDAVKCNSCGRGGVIQVYEGQARVLWETDEEMAEGSPMSTITKELAKLFRKITNSEIDAEGNAHVVLSPADSLLINNARIALASLEAEAVAWAHRLINKRNGVVHPWVYGSAEACPSEGDIFNIEVMPLYAAPPAPVSVHDENGLLPCPFCGGKPEEDAGGCSEYDGHEHQDYSINCMSCGAEVYCSAGSFEKADIPCSCHHNAREVCVDKWNRRAAMLQGAELVTTTYKLPFEEWLSQQNEPIDVDCGCVTTEAFYHWLRVAYEAGNSPVTPDGYALVPVEPTMAMLDEFDSIIDHGAEDSKDAWGRLIAAAPQQEVK